jgi:hypothetical protein
MTGDGTFRQSAGRGVFAAGASQATDGEREQGA